MLTSSVTQTQIQYVLKEKENMKHEEEETQKISWDAGRRKKEADLINLSKVWDRFYLYTITLAIIRSSESKHTNSFNGRSWDF